MSDISSGKRKTHRQGNSLDFDQSLKAFHNRQRGVKLKLSRIDSNDECESLQQSLQASRREKVVGGTTKCLANEIDVEVFDDFFSQNEERSQIFIDELD